MCCQIKVKVLPEVKPMEPVPSVPLAPVEEVEFLDLQSTAVMSPLNWWHLLQRTKSVDEGYLILMRWQTEIQQ